MNDHILKAVLFYKDLEDALADDNITVSEAARLAWNNKELGTLLKHVNELRTHWNRNKMSVFDYVVRKTYNDGITPSHTEKYIEKAILLLSYMYNILIQD